MRSRRTLGWALIAYGMLGIALIVGGAPAGLSLAASVERLAVTADDTLRAAVTSTEAAAAAFVNVDGSLAQAESSAGSAAQLSRDASGTLASLAAAMELSVFGVQPLLPLAGEFETSASQASALGDELADVAGSMGGTREDVARIGTELSGLSTELGKLREAGGSGSAPPPIRAFVLLLLAWLMVPAVGGIVGGAALLRSGMPRSTT